MATVREAATMLGWSETTIRRGCDPVTGWIPHVRTGPGKRGTIRIPLAWLRRVLAGDESVVLPKP